MINKGEAFNEAGTLSLYTQGKNVVPIMNIEGEKWTTVVSKQSRKETRPPPMRGNVSAKNADVMHTLSEAEQTLTGEECLHIQK